MGAAGIGGDTDHLLMEKEEENIPEGESTPVAVPAQPQVLPASTDSRETTDEHQEDGKCELNQII